MLECCRKDYDIDLELRDGVKSGEFTTGGGNHALYTPFIAFISMRMVYYAIVAVKHRSNSMLLLLKQQNGTRGFPQDAFDEKLNGNMNDTVRRMLGTKAGITVKADKIEHLGNFVRPEPDEGRVLLGYAYLTEDYGSEIEFLKEGTDFEWVEKSKILGMKGIDANTQTVLKLFKNKLVS